MLDARIHNYQKPLVLDKIEKPKIEQDNQVLIRVGATSLCHGDLHLINGDWKESVPLNLRIIPGHEIAGWAEEICNTVPKDSIQKGDMAWGMGMRCMPLLQKW
jgi:alcohol dehydrogenase, propanol-preferring